MKTEEYKLGQADVPMDDPDDTDFKIPQTPEGNTDAAEDEASGIDTTLADWFKVDENHNASSSGRDKESSGSETEADSDNADLYPDDDEWLNVEPTSDLPSASDVAEGVRYTPEMNFQLIFKITSIVNVRLPYWTEGKHYI